MKMEFVKVKLDELKPAEYNPRKALTPIDKEYQEIKKSIQEFGYVDPILVNQDGTIIGGHQRYTVLKDLGYTEVEVTRVNLTKEKEKALNVALNKITGRWDSKLLKNLLKDLNEKKFDLSLTGFQPNTLQMGIRGDAEHTQKELVEGILNLEKAQYRGVGEYDVPQIYPIGSLPEVKEWIGFNYVLSDTNPEGKAVHFFIDDYQFERVWNNPDKYIDKLKQYVCVASPDFSPYSDMPLALQIYNHYRKHWVARYWQEHGIKVVPTIRASKDERSLKWFLDGEPRHGVILMSTMWTKPEYRDDDILFVNKIKSILHPTKVLLYGKQLDYLEGDEYEYIESFTQKKWGNK